MTKSKIIQRIERELGNIELVTLLSERLSPTDLQSILLDVYRRLASRRTPSALLADYENNSLVRPSRLSPLLLLEWEMTAFRRLPPEFQPIELSPICPLGTSSVVALVDQNRVMSTTRNSEVVSDSTNVLALECALQRRKLLRDDPKSATPVHLAASHRLLRTQRYSDPRSVSHFAAFALCSGGRDQGGLRFELSALERHIDFYIRALRAFAGGEIPLRLAVTNLGSGDREGLLKQALFEPVEAAHAAVECVFDPERASGRDYYQDVCFHLYARDGSGELLELVDGGAVNWTQALLSNRKERCVISGIGSERVCTELSGERS